MQVEPADLRKRLGVQSLDNTFANFKRVKGAAAAFDAVYGLSQGASYSMVIIYGTTGSGKSHLCDALALEWYGQGMFTRVLCWPDMVKVLRRLTFNRDEGEPYPETIVDRYSKTPRLIIDDYGLGGSDWKLPIEWLERIINYRWHEELPTLLTTNLDRMQLPERVVSRFSDAVIGREVLNSAPDYRPKKVAK